LVAILNRREKQLADSESRAPTDALLAAACDICGGARTRSERQRLIWAATPDDELILAELCRNCATRPEVVLETYGARSHGALWITPANVVSVRESAPARAIGGVVLRGLIYVLVALAAFVVVTAVTSHG